MNKRRLIEAVAIEVTKEFTDRGQLIAAGFAAYRQCVMPKLASAVQVSETQLAFMAGAEHCFSSMMAILDPGDEPTEDDLRRVDQIHKEIEVWRGKLWDRVHPNQGRA